MPMCTIGSHDLCDSTHLRPSWGLQGNNSFYEEFLNFCSNCQRSNCSQETFPSTYSLCAAHDARGRCEWHWKGHWQREGRDTAIASASPGSTPGGPYPELKAVSSMKVHKGPMYVALKESSLCSLGLRTRLGFSLGGF